MKVTPLDLRQQRFQTVMRGYDRGEVNAFYDPNDKYRLSPIAKGYIAGLLRHAREMTLITNQWVNSYKRLVPGYEAPVYVSWALRNRSDLIRIPEFRPGKEQAALAGFAEFGGGALLAVGLFTPLAAAAIIGERRNA